jgi:type I restriction enzyme, R subunit
MEIKEDVGLSQAIKSAINKTTETKKEESEERFDAAIKQILSKAVISDRITDIFEAAGMQKSELSSLSVGFLSEVKEIPQKNLAFEALKKLLNDEIRATLQAGQVELDAPPLHEVRGHAERGLCESMVSGCPALFRWRSIGCARNPTS